MKLENVCLLTSLIWFLSFALNAMLMYALRLMQMTIPRKYRKIMKRRLNNRVHLSSLLHRISWFRFKYFSSVQSSLFILCVSSIFFHVHNAINKLAVAFAHFTRPFYKFHIVLVILLCL